MLIVSKIINAMWRQIDSGYRKLSSLFQVDDNLLLFQEGSVHSLWHQILDDLLNIDDYSTPSVILGATVFDVDR